MRVSLEMPDLELPDRRIVVSCWLVPRGAEVVMGDRLLELLAGEVTVDLPAPAGGRLVEKLVKAGAAVQAGQVLAVIETRGPAK